MAQVIQEIDQDGAITLQFNYLLFCIIDFLKLTF